MSLPARDSGEYTSSTEFLKEYGRLIIDASTLIEKLGHTITPTAESRTFNLERIDDPIKTPESIFEAIGEVNAASIAYDFTPEESSIIVELFGTDKSYRISRSTETNELIDTVLDIKPVDPYTATLFNIATAEDLPHNCESSEDFEKRIHNIPGISNGNFVRLLLEIAQPDLAIDSSEATATRLEATNPFAPDIYRSLIDSSSINSQDAHSFSEYNFTADDSTSIVFSEENGQPSYFQFTCKDPHGDAINIRGTLHKGVELEYPRHAVKKAGSFGEVDTTHSFPLSFSEIKYVRRLFQDELASLPSVALIDEELTPMVDGFASHLGVDEELIDKRIEDDQEETRMEQAARHDALNDEFARFIDEQDDDNL